jgi:hypothetical protein
MAVGARAKILPAAVTLSPCALPSPPAGAQDLSPRPGSRGGVTNLIKPAG